MPGDLQFKAVHTTHEEIVARANNLLFGRAAFETARRLFPNERVDYRDGARIIAHSEPEEPGLRFGSAYAMAVVRASRQSQ
jgi:hypothetical protein